MHFNSMLISCSLFASTVLANARQPQQLNLPERSPDSSPVDFDSDGHWGGAIWAQDPGTPFNRVHAIFTVPNMAATDGQESFANVLVVIDGYKSDCPNNPMLALGLKVHAIPDGSPNYIQAITIISEVVETLDNITISVGDDIQLEIIAHNATIGYVQIDNFTNNGSASKEVNLSATPLCGKTAGWVVGDVHAGSDSYYALANFGTVYFTGASAGTQGGTDYQPYGATIVRHIKDQLRPDTSANLSSTIAFSDGPLLVTYLDQ